LCDHLKAKAEAVECVSNKVIESKVQELKAQLKALCVDEQRKHGSFHTASVVEETGSESLLFEVPTPPDKTMTRYTTAESVLTKDGKETVVITIEFSDVPATQGFHEKPDSYRQDGEISTLISLVPLGSASFK
jgi:hypothetical protein